MKKNELFRLLNILKACGKFRNDARGHLYFYEDEPLGIWKALSREAAYQVIESVLLDEGLLHSDVVSLYTEVVFGKLFAEPKLAEPPDELLVAVENGVFNLATKALQDKNPGLFLRNGLHIHYLQDAESKSSPIWDNFSRRSLDIPSGINLRNQPKVIRLKESIALTCTTLRGAKKAPILIGASNAGKSLVLRLIEKVVGPENCINLSLQDIYDRFRTDFLGSRQVVLVHEIPGKPIKRLDFLKKYIALEPLISEAKGRQPIEIRSYARSILAANALPVLGEVDNGGAFAVRLLPNVFTNYEIPETERDPELLDKLWAERDVIFSIVLNVAAELYSRKMRFTPEPEGDALLAQYRHESDAVPRFLEYCCEKAPKSSIALCDLFEAFINFCRAECLDHGVAMKRTVFRNQIAQLNFEFRKQRVSGLPNPVSCVVGLQWKKGGAALCGQQKTDVFPQTSAPAVKSA